MTILGDEPSLRDISDTEIAVIERVARAIFLAEHPTAEWHAGRARAIWFARAEAAIEALQDARKDGSS
jgi:hypothetical protein